jgi:hypothetical protein
MAMSMVKARGELPLAQKSILQEPPAARLHLQGWVTICSRSFDGFAGLLRLGNFLKELKMPCFERKFRTRASSDFVLVSDMDYPALTNAFFYIRTNAPMN